ncbi:Set1 complex component spp1-like protein [Elsinoe fawcettii]|nr:Set1 complex component spp1-like protein [Elsinoe fawcettii]
MTSLSDLLNPSADDQEQQTRRKDSIPPLQIPNNPYTAANGSKEQGQYHSGPSYPYEITHVTGSLSSTTATPSQSYQTHQRRTSISPPGQHNFATSDSRRMSAYGEGVNSAGLPRADELVRKSSTGSQSYEMRSPETMLRKMSSPTLHQYHMSSRSPEQARRASIIENPDPSFKLAPLQNDTSSTLSQQRPAGILAQQNQQSSHETSALQQDQRLLSGTSASVAPAVTSIATTSHSPLSQAQPTPSHIPSVTSNSADPGSTIASASQARTDQQSSSPKERHLSATPIKSEANPSIRDSIPAFIPVAQVKKETSMVSSTSQREESVPVPSTEDTTTSEARGVKRPAPKNKKGVAKKGPPAKKQKISNDIKTKAKPKSVVKKSGTGTPLDSSPAPRSARAASSVGRSSGSPEARESDGDEEEAGSPDDGEYCICRKGDNGTFMIGCDGKCDDWFHGKCVGIVEKNKNLIDRYICPNCTEAGVGVTTWKRMCRREGCRMPARLAKKDEEPSKYCSEECGITFFRDMMGRTRGASEVLTGRKSRKQSTAEPQEDHGARGGAISQTELKAMLNAVSTVDEFKRLGEGVLSPPATPSPKLTKADPVSQLDEAEAKRVLEISKTKDELRARHALLKDQARFVGMLRHNSARVAEVKGQKPKDICGYDDRVRMDEPTFAKWRNSEDGKAALKAGDLSVNGVKDEDGDEKMNGRRGSMETDICLRKKCPKHYEWAKLSLETNRSEMSENSERMRGLEREEKEIKERAGLRARQIKAGDFGGRVEIHRDEKSTGHDESEAKGLGIGVDGGATGKDGADGIIDAVLPSTETIAKSEDVAITDSMEVGA